MYWSSLLRICNSNQLFPFPSLLLFPAFTLCIPGSRHREGMAVGVPGYWTPAHSSRRTCLCTSISGRDGIPVPFKWVFVQHCGTSMLRDWFWKSFILSCYCFNQWSIQTLLNWCLNPGFNAQRQFCDLWIFKEKKKKKKKKGYNVNKQLIKFE